MDTKRDVIIFIPGLGYLLDQSTEGVARRIANAFDRNAKTASAKFDIQATGKDVTYQSSSNQTTRVCTIVRQDGAEICPVIDIYKLDYAATLTEKYANRNPLEQLVRLFLAIAADVPRLLTAMLPGPKRKAKTFIEKLQLLAGVACLALLVVYGVMLVLAVLGTVQQVAVSVSASAAAQSTPTPSPTLSPATQAAAPATVPLTTTASYPPPVTAGQPAGAPPPDQASGNPWLTAAQASIPRLPLLFIVLAAVVDVFWPNLKQGLIKAAINYMGALEYFGIAQQHNIISGQFAALLEYISEQDNYRQIHIVAYSFGTIVAMNSLFPYDAPPAQRFELINTLVTIGCPFDIVRLYWPKYFKGRKALPNSPQLWLNIYSPVDILASNFRDDPAHGEADQKVIADTLATATKPKNIPYTEGVDPRNLGKMDQLTLIGLRAHAMYWEAVYEGEETCFSAMVTQMYKEDPLLQ